MVRQLDGLRPLIALISNHERPSLENISSNLSERGWAIAALCELSRDGTHYLSPQYCGEALLVLRAALIYHCSPPRRAQ